MRANSNMSRETRRLATAIAPLNRAEIKRAAVVAVEHLRPELARNGQSRFCVLGAELCLTRPPEKKTPIKRRIDVLIVDYLGGRHLRVAVESGRVVEVRPLEGQAVYGHGEIADAIVLAREAPALRIIAGRRGVFTSPFVPGSCAPPARRVGLHFVQSRGKLPAILLASAEIDLIEQRMVHFDVYPTGKLAGSLAT